jgi:excinuclease UvrABC ATPase subunit
VDLGPGGGREGGEVVFAGDTAALRACAKSRTGQALARWTARRAKRG